MSELTCGGCDNTWSGLTRAHCSGCHYTFGGVTSFDKHRFVTKNNNGCKDPSLLDLTQNHNGIWVSAWE